MTELAIRSLHPSLGAEVSGIDLSQPIDAATPGVFVPIFISGGFNHEALVWHANLDTLAKRQAAFAGTPVYVQQLL